MQPRFHPLLLSALIEKLGIVGFAHRKRAQGLLRLLLLVGEDGDDELIIKVDLVEDAEVD